MASLARLKVSIGERSKKIFFRFKGSSAPVESRQSNSVNLARESVYFDRDDLFRKEIEQLRHGGVCACSGVSEHT